MKSATTRSAQLSTQKDWEWWRMKVVLPPQFRDPSRNDAKFKRYISNITEVRGELTEPYGVQTAWERARRKCDPLLSPHGMLRALRYRDNFHAIEFLEMFGPLSLRQSPDGYIRHRVLVRIPLDEFWQRQAHFQQLAQLYESRNDPTQLANAFRRVIEHKPEHDIFRHIREHLTRGFNAALAVAGRLQVSYTFPDSTKLSDVIRLAMIEGEEGQATGQAGSVPEQTRMELSDELPCNLGHIPDASFEEQHSEAMALLRIEIDRHIANRKVQWLQEEDVWRLHVSSATSLWDMIWDLFASDTSGTVWRVCPHCQRIFYPVRADRFYCTTRQQVLASKRAYAQRVRKRAKEKKR